MEQHYDYLQLALSAGPPKLKKILLLYLGEDFTITISRFTAAAGHPRAPSSPSSTGMLLRFLDALWSRVTSPPNTTFVFQAVRHRARPATRLVPHPTRRRPAPPKNAITSPSTRATREVGEDGILRKGLLFSLTPASESTTPQPAPSFQLVHKRTPIPGTQVNLPARLQRRGSAAQTGRNKQTSCINSMYSGVYDREFTNKRKHTKSKGEARYAKIIFNNGKEGVLWEPAAQVQPNATSAIGEVSDCCTTITPLQDIYI